LRRQIAEALEAAHDNPADTAMMTEIGVILGHGASVARTD